MASNSTPDDDDVLCALAEDLADGGHLHEVAIDIKQNTEAVMRSTIASVTAAKLSLGAARNALSSAGGFYEVIEAADAAGTTVIRNCRLRLVKVLGTEYSAGWGQAGFPGLSTAIPKTRDLRFTLLGALGAYFTANPAAASAEMEAPAAICNAAHTVVSNARQAVNTGEQAVTDGKAAAATAVKTLRKRVRGLIEELGQLIADDDARYLAFGLNIPANPSAPLGIETLTGAPQGGGKVFLEWSYAKRMASTRIEGRHVGVETDFHSLGTVDALEKMLTTLAAGTWEFQVVAYNDGGDGPASPIVSVTVT